MFDVWCLVVMCVCIGECLNEESISVWAVEYFMTILIKIAYGCRDRRESIVQLTIWFRIRSIKSIDRIIQLFKC